MRPEVCVLRIEFIVQRMRQILAAAIVLLLSAGAPALAVTDDERAAIRGVIEQQIDAFRRDDAIAAYSFAAPNIQTLFPNAAMFFRMVRDGYPAVYRARATQFQALVDKDDSVAQTVEITDFDNQAWIALYTLQRQDDGSWKISGCIIKRAPGQST